MTSVWMRASPLPPQRYRALRARYNALLVTLYERTSLTLREVAAAAGHTERAVQMLVRALGCRPRNARMCRPGTNVGVRRAGPKPAPLNAPATRRMVEAFAEAARGLAASADAQVASELQRATARAARRTMRTQTRVITSAARKLRHVAVAMEHVAATRDALADHAKRGARHHGARKAAKAPKRPSQANLSGADLQLAQERMLRDQQARMWEAHQTAAGAPGSDAGAGKRNNEIAARYVKVRQGPRIRSLS